MVNKFNTIVCLFHYMNIGNINVGISNIFSIIQFVNLFTIVNYRRL